MKHLLSFEVITEFLGHVPSYKRSSHAFQKNHSVVGVCSISKFETFDWFFTKTSTKVTILEGVHRCTD